MYPYPKPLYFSFLAFFLSFGLSAQQTISGRVFHGDGSEQIGAIVCASNGNEDCMSSEANDSLNTFTLEFYTLTLPDSIAYLYFNWDGMVNPVVPIAGRDTLNLINASYWEMAHDRYPEEKIPARAHSIQVAGIVEEFRKKEDYRQVPLAGATLTPMVSPEQPLASVTSDAGGQFSLTIPPEAGVLRMQYKWVDKYYVLPPVRTLYVPFLLGVGRDMKQQKKRRKQWERQQRKGRN